MILEITEEDFNEAFKALDDCIGREGVSGDDARILARSFALLKDRVKKETAERIATLLVSPGSFPGRFHVQAECSCTKEEAERALEAIADDIREKFCV